MHCLLEFCQSVMLTASAQVYCTFIVSYVQSNGKVKEYHTNTGAGKAHLLIVDVTAAVNMAHAVTFWSNQAITNDLSRGVPAAA